MLTFIDLNLAKTFTSETSYLSEDGNLFSLKYFIFEYTL